MPEIIDINAGASEVRRRAAAEKQYANTTVTRQYLAVIIEKYHNETVSPILLSHEERMVYLEMWPWQKAMSAQPSPSTSPKATSQAR